MYSKIKLHLATISSEARSNSTLSNSSTMPLRMAEVQQYKMEDGYVLAQSASHFLAHLEMFEYEASKECRIGFSIIEPAFLFCANLQTNSCYLCYRPAGNYYKKMDTGKHQQFLLTLRPDWLFHQSNYQPELADLTAHYCKNGNQARTLPPCYIAGKLFNRLKRMGRRIDNLNTDAEGYIFINECIRQYCDGLSSGKVSDYRSEKIAALNNFITMNFATSVVNDLTEMASLFCVSERTLARLAKMAFGIPIHEQVISVRMKFAFNQLSTTNKPIFEIARLSGYTDPHYFSKAFKKYHGTSPKQIERPHKRSLTYSS
ncbi:helix-turn-helix transcriptional regulator [Pedobacter africanus]|uniref:AraC-type DNA-binding protein n=1 Tax=Pedobacter africanus TaxID=151894 RepID=A0A1W2DI79_9SPHI|nr:helix-turn-helix transcriptional regulator [Pedobacter africanus]SMC97124.1 AraC-type DNA-binding protein [Pedobacter africanus]